MAIAPSPVGQEQVQIANTDPRAPVADGNTAPPPNPRMEARAKARERAKEAADAARAMEARAKEAAAGQPAPEPPAPQAAKPAPVKTEPEPPATETVTTEPNEPADQDVDVKLRIRRREQQIRGQLQRREAELAAREAQLSQVANQATQILKRDQELAQLRQRDALAWARAVGLDQPTHEQVIKGIMADGKPEAQVLTLQRQIEELRRETQQFKTEQAKAAESATRAQSEANFAKLTGDVTKYPTLAAIYGDDARSLVRAAYQIQEDFVAQHRRPPTQEEIAYNLERIERSKYLKANGKTAPAPAEKPKTEPAKPKPRAPTPRAQTDVSAPQEPNGRESAKERRERAALAARRAMDARAQADTPIVRKTGR